MCVSKTIWKGNEYGKRDNQDGIQADNRDRQTHELLDIFYCLTFCTLNDPELRRRDSNNIVRQLWETEMRPFQVLGSKES